jgi:RNA polymerase sigma-70 factor (ECF subfamily)
MLSRHWRSRPAEDLHETLENVSPGNDPWSGVDDRLHGGSVLRSALATLPTKEREILTLVVWEELSLVDAARVLGIPAGTARYLLHQARLTLRNDPKIVALMHDYNSVKETQ